MAVFETILQGIGNTPLVKMDTASWGIAADIKVKMESLNPLSSVKDRLGLALIEDAEERGILHEKTCIVEPTSGNTGIALAYIAAVKKYPLFLAMPESMSMERRHLLKALGAQVVLTPAANGMRGAIEEAERIAKEEHGHILGQFTNPVNPQMHEATTGPEIWADTVGDIDVFITGVGTGGTIMGVGRYLKKRNPHIRIVAVEPAGSPVLSGGTAGPHKIQGIGAGFIPSIVDTVLFDEVISVMDDDAKATAQRMAMTNGMLVGLSSGANVWAALQYASRAENKGKKIVTVACDTGERYLSSWLFQD